MKTVSDQLFQNMYAVSMRSATTEYERGFQDATTVIFNQLQDYSPPEDTDAALYTCTKAGHESKSGKFCYRCYTGAP